MFSRNITAVSVVMSDNSYEGEEHFDKYDHYNYDQEKVMMSGNSGEWREGD